MRDHDEVIKYVLQRAEEIKREEENGTAGAENENNPTTAKPSGILSGKWFKGITVVVSCCVLVGAAWFVVSKLGGNKKPVDNPAGTTTTPSGISTVSSATPTISEEPHGKPMGTWYLTCDSEMEREYNHGEAIVKKYRIISRIEMSDCEVVADKCDGVEVVSIDTIPDSTGNAWTYAWEIALRFRVNDAVDPGSLEFTVTPVFTYPEQAPPDLTMKNLKQIIYVCNIGQKDYVCLNVIDGLYDYSEKVRKYIDDLNRQGESVVYERPGESDEYAIEYCQSREGDREARYAESVLRRIEMTGDEEAGGAICIVTLLNVYTDNCTEEIGCVVPIAIKVEKVLLQNDRFALREGDEILTWDHSRWRRNNDGFTVLFQEGYIPIAQVGSQYIVMIAEETESAKKQSLLPLDYCVTAYSIPIEDKDGLSEDKVYELLGLPDDVRKCSEDLLKMFVWK